MKNILITGAAGFIGFHLSTKLLSDSNNQIIGIDNLNSYYDIDLKNKRLSLLEKNKNFIFKKIDISDKNSLFDVFEEYHFDVVINLAAQAGVRYSISNPDTYINSNIIGFYNILEACRKYKITHLVFASSSSVYGMNKKVPYSTSDKTDNPVSLYAATKKANELLAYSYSKLYGIPTTGFRFFTVYGPFGRPDMAYFKFSMQMMNNQSIQLYNNGNLSRDFTYIDDIVNVVSKSIFMLPKKDENDVPFKVYNIGNNNPVCLLDFVQILECCLMKEKIITKPAKIELLPMQPGDVYTTYADVDEIIKDFEYKPKISLEEGLAKFAYWFKSYISEKEEK